MSATMIDISKLICYLQISAYSSSAVDAMANDRDYLRWVNALGKIFTDCALEEVNVEIRYEPYEITTISMELLCVVCEECASGMSDLRAANLLRDMTRRAHLEMRQGTTVCKALQVVVGRKPQKQHGGSALSLLAQQKPGLQEQDGSAGSPLIPVRDWVSSIDLILSGKKDQAVTILSPAVNEKPTPAPRPERQVESASNNMVLVDGMPTSAPSVKREERDLEKPNATEQS